MSKKFLLLLLFVSISFGQNIDSLKVKIPKKAALWSIIPGGGQLYNGRYLKAGVIIALESLAIQQSIKNGKEYSHTNKMSNLNDRNKYAWWALLFHVYGTLDAVVDSHLQSFNDIMKDDSFEKDSDIGEEEINGK